MAHRKWKEIKLQPSMLPGSAVTGCSLVSFHFLWAILCPQAVQWLFGGVPYKPYRVHSNSALFARMGMRSYISRFHTLSAISYRHSKGMPLLCLGQGSQCLSQTQDNDSSYNLVRSLVIVPKHYTYFLHQTCDFSLPSRCVLTVFRWATLLTPEFEYISLIH